MSRSFISILATAGALLASPACAADDVWCASKFDFAQASQLGLAQVAGSERTYFHGFDFECQKRREPCQLRGYLVGGDLVVTAPQTKGDLTCVAFVGRAGATTGWVETKKLNAKPVPATLTAKDWLGAWRRDEFADFTVTRRKGQLYVSGDALYMKYGPDGKPSEYGPNDGAFSGLIRLRGNRGEVNSEDTDCTVRMARIGPYALLEDDNACGGLNVTFRGFYRRTSLR